MRLCHRAGHGVPLLTICAALVGCASSIVEPPANFNSNPQVVSIFAVDSTTGVLPLLPDVLLFSTDPADISSGKISTNPPPSYGSYRVEFDQPVNDATVANNADRPTAAGGNASFCSPLASSPIQLVDVQGDTSRAAGPIVASVCYDSSSPLGSHAHVLVVPGRGALTDATAKPLTCNTFRSENGSSGTLNGNIFKPNHKYGIQIKSGTVTNRAGKALTAPTGAGWVGDTFQFTTSGLKILAAGFQDPNTGFFVWLDKPEPGFEKDLAPLAAAYQHPSDATPFIVVLSEPVGDVSAIKLQRKDDAAPIPSAVVITGGNIFGDGRIVEVNTGDITSGGSTFEPSQAYTLTIPGSLTADTGTETLGTQKIYSFTAAPGTLRVLSTTPAASAVAVSTGTSVAIEFSAPVAADATTNVPTGATFKITGPSGDVPLDPVTVDPTTNNQVVTLSPKSALVPETVYSVTATGVKVAASPKALANQPFPSFGPIQFTTATFRMSRISIAPSTANIDRTTAVSPTAMKTNLQVVFNSSALGVDANSVTLSELSVANVATKIPGFTVTQNSPTTFTIALPASYQPKFGQKYEVRTATTITDAVSGKKLKAEGCIVADCSDVKSFTTRKVGATVAADPSSAAPTGFKVTFTDPIDPASITPFLGTEFKLFQRTATGALNTTPVPITCVITSATVVTCTANASLGNAPNQFLASAVFLQTATAGQGGPAVVAPTVSTDPSAKFFGSVSANIFSPCP